MEDKKMKQTETESGTENRILLSFDGEIWFGTFVGPQAAEIQRLFGDVRIPTPFGPHASVAEVRAHLQKLNPDVEVV